MTGSADGERVLHAAVNAAAEVFGDQLDAAFALGSLAHGGFTPLVSDVDVALVLRSLPSADRVATVYELVRSRHRDRLAQRLSVFWSDWPGVHHGHRGGDRLPPVDRLDLLRSGRLLHGTDRRAGAVPPSTDDLVRGAAEFATERFDAAYFDRLRSPEVLLADGVRATTKAVLFPVRFLYTRHTGRFADNDTAATWYRGPARPLVTAALRWRTGDITDHAAARRLLDAHLIALYQEFAADYGLTLP